MLRTVRLLVPLTRTPTPVSVSFTRAFSIFGSESPSAGLAKSIDLGNFTTGEQVLDASVPLGAPKPSALNRLRQSGRTPEARERRSDEVESKIRKAQEYKAAKQAAEKKKAEEAQAAAAAAQKK